MKRLPVFIAVLFFLIIAALVAWPAVRITKRLSQGQAMAETAFKALLHSAKMSVSIPDDVQREQWRGIVAGDWQRNPRILAVVIKSGQGDVLYAKPTESPYYEQTASGLAFNKKLGATLQCGADITAAMRIEALYTVLTQEDIFYPLRDTVIALTALIIVILAWLLVAHNKSAEAVAVRPANVYVPEPAAQEESAAVQAEASFIHTDDSPRGLFDKETGLGWEEYLHDRLDAELRRSASFEQDLCLLVVSYDGVQKQDDEFAFFIARVTDFFTFKDMSFLFGETGAAVILSNIDIDHGIRMGEEFHRKFYAAIRKRSPEVKGRIYSGLSSRAGRLVDADRVILEAQTALSKAITDGSVSIMAFRPDPDKFRAYLSAQ